MTERLCACGCGAVLVSKGKWASSKCYYKDYRNRPENREKLLILHRGYSAKHRAKFGQKYRPYKRIDRGIVVCRVCGKEFQDHSHPGKPAVYCSDVCRMARKRKVQKSPEQIKAERDARVASLYEAREASKESRRTAKEAREAARVQAIIESCRPAPKKPEPPFWATCDKRGKVGGASAKCWAVACGELKCIMVRATWRCPKKTP